MDFSSISRRNRLLGKILRFPLDLIPHGTVMPILQGVLKGQKWIVGASLHSCWLGSYELQKQEIVARHVQLGDVFYDIGANVGFYSLLAARLVGEMGHVYSFEPLPQNVAFIHRHIALNHLRNITVYEFALANHQGIAHFQRGDRDSMGKLADSGEIEVQVSSLDYLIDKERLRAPSVLKIDVEGAEYEVLKGASQLLIRDRPLIFLATHGAEVEKLCRDFLTGLNYRLDTFPSVDYGGEFIAYG